MLLTDESFQAADLIVDSVEFCQFTKTYPAQVVTAGLSGYTVSVLNQNDNLGIYLSINNQSRKCIDHHKYLKELYSIFEYLL